MITTPSLVRALSSFVFRSLKIALYGPRASGKTTFLRTLIGKTYSSTNANGIEIVRTYRLKIPITGTRNVVVYRLIIFDLPGAPKFRNLRLSTLKGVSGYIFFYDSTSLNSPQMLFRMIKSELEANKKLKSALAMIVLATEKDLGADRKALRYGNDTAAYLSNKTLRYYGYAVPHLLISNLNQKDVSLVVRALETIFFDIRNDIEVLRKLGVKIESLRQVVYSIEGLSHGLARFR